MKNFNCKLLAMKNDDNMTEREHYYISDFGTFRLWLAIVTRRVHGIISIQENFRMLQTITMTSTMTFN